MINITVSKEKKEQIVNYYIKHREEKGIVDRIINKFEISKKTFYNILNERGIKLSKETATTPEDDEYEDEKDDTNDDDKPEVLFYFDDSEINPDSIILKFKAMGWLEKANAQRVINISNYIEDTYGINVWESYINYLIWMINSLESKQLETDIKQIKERNFQIFDTPQTKREKIEKKFYDQMLETLIDKPDMIKESIIESQPEPQQQDFDLWGNLIMLTNPKMFGLYKMITDNNFRDIYLKSLKQFQQFSKLVKSKKPNLKKVEKTISEILKKRD